MFFPQLKRRGKYEGQKGVYTYRKYKAEIAKDCLHRCVYCDGHQNSFGGYDLMELDHFRPKAEKLFPELEKEPTNLVLACRSCNGKKRDDWPAGKSSGKTHVQGLGYIDPFKVNRALYFSVEDCGKLTPRKAPATYMIEELSLNRPFAVALRARRRKRAELHTAIDKLADELRRLESSDIRAGKLGEIADLLKKANQELRYLEIEDGPTN